MQAAIDRRIILRYLVLPALIGIAAVLAVHGLLARVGRQTGPAPIPVVVTRQIVPARTVLTASLLTIKDFPPGLVGRTAVHQVQGVLGRTTTQPLATGEVLYDNALAGRGDHAALSYHIPPHLRALAVSVSEEIAVADMLQPGDRVDILSVPRTGARLLVPHVAVLAVGQNQDTTPKPPSPGSVHTVTLALTPAQALAVVTAEHQGPLRLLLDPAAGVQGTATATATGSPATAHPVVAHPHPVARPAATRRG